MQCKEVAQHNVDSYKGFPVVPSWVLERKTQVQGEEISDICREGILLDPMLSARAKRVLLYI